MFTFLSVATVPRAALGVVPVEVYRGKDVVLLERVWTE